MPRCGCGLCVLRLGWSRLLLLEGVCPKGEAGVVVASAEGVCPKGEAGDTSGAARHPEPEAFDLQPGQKVVVAAAVVVAAVMLLGYLASR
eukprot:3239503-Amphidinium_carterae.2